MSLYTQLAEIPVPVSAQFISAPGVEPTTVQVTYTVRDHAQNIKRTMSKTISLNANVEAVVSSPLHDVDIVAQIASRSGEKTAMLRNSKVSGNVKRVVEVWNQGSLEMALDVTDHHGDFYTDEFIASLSFSPSETSLVYTAEGNMPESKDPYQKFRFNPDFGEGLPGKRRPTTFVVTWKPSATDSASTIPTRILNIATPGDIRFGQATFSAKSDEIIYATGYEFTQDGRILGIKGCFNRPTGIWSLRIPKNDAGNQRNKQVTTVDVVEAQKLTPANLSCRSPRVFIADGEETLFWLACKTGGAHLGASTLHALKTGLAASSANTLVDVVNLPEAGAFPGLYPGYNIPSAFSLYSPGGKPSIVIGSQWGSRATVLRISVKDGEVQELTPCDNNLSSWAILATDGESRVICTRSSPSEPSSVVLGTRSDTGSVTWRDIDQPTPSEGVAKALSTIKTSIIQIPGRPLVETIVLQGTAGSKAPCIIAPHGGPHGTTSTAFSPNTAAMVLEGYTISLPNYSGSPGFGENFLQALIGRCGELDVEDCIASARHLVKLGISEEGAGKQLVMGGSHGGFLAAHLIGQFPSFFSAAVMRNPVISAGEVSNTDIPDWYFSEFGIDYPLASSPFEPDDDAAKLPASPPPRVDVDTYARLHVMSPVAHLAAMTAPVLLLIGAADRRVAPTHGIEFYHALKARYIQPDLRARGARVEMLVFEGESHPLDGVEAARVGFEATRDWMASARK